MSAKVHDPITPGEILLTEFLEPLGISQYRLAQATGLPQTRISEIVHGRRRITPGTGLRLFRAQGPAVLQCPFRGESGGEAAGWVALDVVLRFARGPGGEVIAAPPWDDVEVQVGHRLLGTWPAGVEDVDSLGPEG